MLKLRNSSKLGDMDLVQLGNLRCINALKGIKGRLKFQYMLYLINHLPSNVLNRLITEDTVIRLDTLKNVQKAVNSKKIVGFFTEEQDTKIIYIAERSFISKKQLKSTLYHEIGHFVDRCVYQSGMRGRGGSTSFLFASAQDVVFHDICNEERHVFKHEYYRENIIEYFAQAFAEVLMRNKHFQSMTPNTTNLVNGFINSL